MENPTVPSAFRPTPERTAIIGMVHALALPGTPRYGGGMEAVLERATEEARAYRQAGVDAVMVENMHDVPYLKGAVGPEITAAMALVARTVKAESGLPTGLQILAGANREALAVACATGLDFIRVEGFVFAHVADEGLIESCAGELLRYRRMLGAERVAVYADIKKKHSSHALTSDVDLAETARAASFFGADGVIVTGVATGAETNLDEVRSVRDAVSLPVLVGSGVTEANVERYLGLAHALVVGSHFKAQGRWENPVEPSRVRSFMARVRAWREARK